MDVEAEKSRPDTALPGISPASQTLVRGLDVLEQVAEGPAALSTIARELGLSRSTVHRLATTLLERRYLNANPRRGYSLGPKLLELGWLAGDQISLVRLARPYLETLAARIGDVALLAIRDRDSVLIADQAAGRRRVLPSLRTGDRLPLADSALGRALLAPSLVTATGRQPHPAIIDRGEFEPEICTVAAAVHGADGGVRAALGIAAAATCIGAPELAEAVVAITAAARDMSAELGWHAPTGHAVVSSTPAGRGEAAQGLRANKDEHADIHTAGASARGTGPHALPKADMTAEGERDRMEGSKP